MKVRFVEASCCKIPPIVKNKNIDEIQQTLVQKQKCSKVYLREMIPICYPQGT